ncbi:hypothetical protein [Cognatishimia activa]|uniref:hypothetical protein n=1 Tax=Cognatishimia activa TaxID=1715691 RepID=UPI002230F3A2|nr:hypothetical protein [Cognatishimia activa]UZD90312.1 hypothetical protein M0D42_12045 [Cognatishimia activa]
MKEAPFNISMVLLGTYLAVTLLGGVVGAIVAAIGMSTLWGGFLAGVLPVPFGGVVRQGIASMFAQEAGVTGDAPLAFSLGVRVLIGAVFAFGIAYLFSSTEFYSIGFGLGAVCALLTGLLTSLIFLFTTMFGSG